MSLSGTVSSTQTREDQARNNTNSADNNNKKKVVVKQTLTPTINLPTIPTQAIPIIKKTEDLDLSTHPIGPVVKLTTPQRTVSLEQMQRTGRLPGIDDRGDKTKSNREKFRGS